MRDTLRFITCGSVDDGKSTLIGRLLYESKQVFEDHLREAERASGKYGTQGEQIDLALLVDGLQAEREQGITIDVAYRFFSTENRKFIVADTPGHEQYTRNMATGASTAKLAVLLVDARKGLLTQTRRHSRIVSMLGVRHVVLAINKMDLVDWSESVFDRIRQDFQTFAEPLEFSSVQAIPISALTGKNIATSGGCQWYSGPTLLQYLETVDVDDADVRRSLRLPVQYVNRPNSEFRGYCGSVASGDVRVGDKVRVVPGGAEAKVQSIVIGMVEHAEAVRGEAVTLTLDREIDISRGQVICSYDDPVAASDQFEASVLCLSEHHLVPGRSYYMKLHNIQLAATIAHIKNKLDINEGSLLAANTLALNDIGQVTISTSQPVAFEPYSDSPAMGAFILIDRLSNETIGAGMIRFALRRASNIHWQALDVNKGARANIKSQRPACIWLTGLSGSGKSTIANQLEKRLHAAGRHTYLLDGDNVRHGLNRDLGFTEADRAENIRRVAEVSRLMVDAGLIVIVSFISPFRSEREFARSLFEKGEFFEVYIDTPIEECEKRDVKGLYAKARQGKLANFTGIDSPYEAPLAPEFRIDTIEFDPEECTEQIFKALS
jgi:bifunctional enzyme CysN/CysC